MTTVYLHVGMPKCASSTIQGYFNRFDRRNLKSGFVYPRVGRSMRGYFSHAPIVTMNSDQIKELVVNIRIEAEDAEVVFISSEQFVNAYWDRAVAGDLIRQLNSAFGAPNVRLLFLFRNHFPFIESGFAQFLKGGLYRVEHGRFFENTAGDVESFCAYFRESNGFDFFDYAHVIETFRRFCDRENKIEVYSIEKGDLETGDILDELCRRFSLVPPTRKKVKNPRFPVKALLGLAYGIKERGFGTVHPLRHGVAKTYADAVDGFSPILHIHGEFTKAVAARQRADLEYFRREFGGGYSELFRPRPHLQLAEDPQGEVRLTDEDRAWLDGYFGGI